MVANMTSPAGDPNIPGYVALAKDVMRSIEIRMDLGGGWCWRPRY